MSAVLLIVLVGVAVVVTIRSARRGLSDRHTVEEHHRTLDTLGEIAHRQDTEGRLSERPPRVAPPPAQPHIRVMPPGGQAAESGQPAESGQAAGSGPEEPPQPVRWSPAELPAGGPGPVSDQPVPEREPLTGQAAAPPVESPPVESPLEPAPGPLEPGPTIPTIPPIPPATHEPAPASSPASALQGDIPPLSAPIAPAPRTPSRPAPVPPEPAAPLVALTVSGGEVPGEPRGPWRKRVIAGVSAAATLLVAVGAITIVATATRSGGHHPRLPATEAAPATPAPTVTSPTTVAPKASAVLIDSNSQGARYSVQPSAASIELVATSRCWVQVRTGSAVGPVTFQATMHVGDHLPLPTTGAVWLRLGNPPGVSIVVDGTPLHLVTSSVAQPYNLELQPST